MNGKRAVTTPADSVGQPSPVVHMHIIYKLLTILASELSDEEAVEYSAAYLAEMESQGYVVGADLAGAKLQLARDSAHSCIAYCSLTSSTGEGLLRYHIAPLFQSLPPNAARWKRPIHKSDSAFFKVDSKVIKAMNADGRAMRAAMNSYINPCAKPVMSTLTGVGLEVVAPVKASSIVVRGVVVASASLLDFECTFPHTSDREGIAGHTLGLAGFVNAVCNACKPNAALTFRKSDYVCPSWHTFSVTALRKIHVGEALVVMYESDGGGGADESSFASCSKCL